jgi:hypothetical protein
MRYIFLIYSREGDATGESVRARHYAVMDAAAARGVLVAAQPLQETATATTVRMDEGKPLVVDGPFAETKEQLAGYYIIDCKDLDEAIEWAKQIPTTCKGGAGCIEIRPLQQLPPR